MQAAVDYKFSRMSRMSIAAAAMLTLTSCGLWPPAQEKTAQPAPLMEKKKDPSVSEKKQDPSISEDGKWVWMCRPLCAQTK